MIRVMTVLVGLLALLVVSHLNAQAPPVKIGLLLPYTGPLTVQGTDTTNGFELYLKKIGGRAGGRELRVIKEDTEAKPGSALRA